MPLYPDTFGNIRRALRGSTAVILPASVLIVAEGDSITVGLGSTGVITSYVDRGVSSGLPSGPNYTYNKVATSGETAASMDNNYANGTPNAAISVTAGPGGGVASGTGAGPAYSSSPALAIATIMAGGNDNAVQNPGIVYRALRSFIRKARASGYQRVLVGTILSRNAVAFTSSDNGPDHNLDGSTLPVNVDIRTYFNGDLGADFLFDIAAPFPTQASFVAPYTSDGTHPSDTGYLYVGPTGKNMVTIYRDAVTLAVSGPGVRVQGLTWSKYDQSFTDGSMSSDLRTYSAVAGNNSNRGVRGLPSIGTTGLFYWEIKFGVAGNLQPGIATQAFESNIQGSISSIGSGTFGMFILSGFYQYNGATINGSTSGVSQLAGDVQQYAFNATTGMIWNRVVRSGTAGLWNQSASADPATGVGGVDVRTGRLGSATIYPAGTIYSGANASLISCFKASEQIGPVPSGFSTFG